MATPVEVVERIQELALAHPAYGCNKVEALLALEGRRVSAITVQKILNDKGLGTRHERWLALERQNAALAIELTPATSTASISPDANMGSAECAAVMPFCAATYSGEWAVGIVNRSEFRTRMRSYVGCMHPANAAATEHSDSQH